MNEKKEVHKVAPIIPEGMIGIAMSKEDIITLANLMSICSQTFEKLAMHAAQENNEQLFTILQSRYKLSFAFAQKLVEACKMPEPISRDIH